jgi:membrane-bound lytic murein transglycosylase D
MMPKIGRLAFCILVGGFLHMVAAAEPDAAPQRAPAGQRVLFPVLHGLEPQVEFWKKIFATYSSRQVVIHDALHLDRVYEVLDFESWSDNGFSDAEIAAYSQDKVRSEKERIRAILLRLHQGEGTDPRNLSPEERKIWGLFADVNNPSKFLEAAADDRIRSQAGLRERFAAGVEVSRRYLPEMERIFRHAGLPVELTRLPLVESCFNLRAYSKAGAAGIWQFMPVTARSYMRVDRFVDERRDPIISTRAAAEHLRANYEVLGNWPLAITAYNHGRAGVANAVATVGSSDLMQIIQRYRGAAFKFASRNFYAEFLAALDVERNFSKYFGKLYPAAPRATESVIVPASTSFHVAARASDVDVETLAELNPALARDVISGRHPVPKGYELRVPVGGAAGFERRCISMAAPKARQVAGVSARARVPKASRRGQKAEYLVYRVERGQTLSTIAKRYGTTVSAIRRKNKLRANHIRTGQRLMIPTTSS